MTENQIKILYEIVKDSPFISGNSNYKKKANSTYITYKNDDTVNAYATLDDKENPYIAVYAGLVNVFEVFGYALASGEHELIRSMMGAVNRIVNGSPAEVTTKTHKDKYGKFNFFDRCKCIDLYSRKPSDAVRREAESITAGAILAVISHELGHHSLGHVTEQHPHGHRFAVSRNNERCADLFASSVCDSTMFARYCIPGTVMMTVCLAWLHDGVDEATTHPYSEERLDYMFNSHEKELRDYGITREVVNELLPKKPYYQHR